MPPQTAQYVINPWPWLALATLYGACVGSFLNVVIHRVPAGQSLLRPGSHCPRCQHPLAWYDNIPVLGWILLRGRCRYCRQPIDLQYPVVEALTAALFGGLFALLYLTPLRPDFQSPEFIGTLPLLLSYLVLVGALLAATIIDARFFIIPLSIVWAAAVAGLALALALALCVDLRALPLTRADAAILLPRAPPEWWGGISGGVAGLGIANLLLHFRILPRSFEVPAAAATGSAHAGGAPSTPAAEPGTAPPSTEAATPAPEPHAQPVIAGAAVVLGTLVLLPVCWIVAGPWGLGAGLMLLWIAVIGVGAVGAEAEAADAVTQEITEHPHPRREVLKECVFLSPVAAGILLGGWLLPWDAWVGTTAPDGHPFALEVLAGCCLGYIVGAGLVWVTRILGTLAFGREAMGLGDVHLLGTIGVVLGPIDAVFVFFTAPFLGLAYAVGALALSRFMRLPFRVIPYGPHLAGGVLVVMVLRIPLYRFFGMLGF